MRRQRMPKKNEESKLENFKVEKVFEGRIHERYEFTFKVESVEFKGYFHEDKIQWLHPHPNQIIDESKVETIESTIYALMEKYGISSGIKEPKNRKSIRRPYARTPAIYFSGARRGIQRLRSRRRYSMVSSSASAKSRR